jgi:hypothetical protein
MRILTRCEKQYITVQLTGVPPRTKGEGGRLEDADNIGVLIETEKYERKFYPYTSIQCLELLGTEKPIRK